MHEQSITMPRALLFDMDGTLTQPYFDFEAIRREIGVDGPILEALAKMSSEQRTAAELILHRHEEQAAAESALNHGCDRLIDWIRQRKLRTALITRNRRINVETVLRRHGLEFDVLITREDGQFKPSPEPLHLACQKLGVKESEAWMIGDAVYDVLAGQAAGAKTVWISHGQPRTFEPEPWRTAADLGELLNLLCGCHTS